MISWIHLLGVVATVALLLAISWWSGRRVKDARTFITGGNSGSWMVCGALLGTLAGGQSTIGTAQLAFCYGLSAWWFTIGAGLGALVLGLFYAGPLRRSGCSTLLEVVSREYGRKAETVGSILFLIGIFISIMSQVLSSSAMIGSLFGISTLWASIIGAILIVLMVFFAVIMLVSEPLLFSVFTRSTYGRLSEVAEKIKSLSLTGTDVKIPVWLPERPPEAIASLDCWRLYSDCGDEPWNRSDKILSFW